MPRTAEALVKSELLRWAREESGRTVEDVARKARVKPERLVGWEQGEVRPTVAQLRTLAGIYKRPLAAFYLPEPPASLPTPRDFRRLAPGPPLSPQLRLAHREAVHRRELALELLQDIGEAPAAFTISVSTKDDPEDTGERLRAGLGVTREVQTCWPSAGHARRAWTEACEHAGALVCQARNVAPEEMSGFSIAEFPLPVVVVNIKDADERRIFTLLHEMAHLATRQGGLCHLDDGLAGTGRGLEVFCNRVAGAALVPLADLRADDVVQRATAASAWSDDEIERLRRRFRVSREVVLLRLVAARLASREFYERKRAEIRGERRASKRQGAGGGPAPPRGAIAKAGRMFARLVIRAYHLDRITTSDVADFLEVRVRDISGVEAELFRSAAIGRT